MSSLQTLDTGNLLTVSSVNIGGLSGGSATLSSLSGSSDLASATAAASTVDNLDALSDALNTQLSTLGAKSRQIDGQLEFTSNLSDVIETGIGNLVDADLAKESAKLQALQVRQQLGVQALSIANQAPQTILSLFR